MDAYERAKAIILGTSTGINREECIELAQQLSSDPTRGDTVCMLLDLSIPKEGLPSPELANLMAKRYGGAFGQKPDELLEKLWTACGQGNYNLIDDFREELAKSRGNLEHVFWVDISARLGSSTAARMAPLFALNTSKMAFVMNDFDSSLKTARVALYWLEQIENGLDGFDYPWGSLSGDADLAPKYSQALADTWAIIGRSSYMIALKTGGNPKSDDILHAFSVGFEKGSYAAGFYLSMMMPATDEDWDAAAERAASMLDFDMEACLAEIDGLPESDSNLQGNSLLNLAAQGYCFGSGNLPISYDKAYGYYEIAAQRGDETAKEELTHFKKKLFGGLDYRP